MARQADFSTKTVQYRGKTWPQCRLGWRMQERAMRQGEQAGRARTIYRATTRVAPTMGGPLEPLHRSIVGARLVLALSRCTPCIIRQQSQRRGGAWRILVTDELGFPAITTSCHQGR